MTLSWKKTAATGAGGLVLSAAIMMGLTGTAHAADGATPQQVEACATALVNYAAAHGIAAVEALFLDTGGKGVVANVAAKVPACAGLTTSDLEGAAVKAYLVYGSSQPALSSSQTAALAPCEASLSADVTSQGAATVVKAVAAGNLPSSCASLTSAEVQSAVQHVLSSVTVTTTPSSTASGSATASSSASSSPTVTASASGTATTAAPATGGGTEGGDGMPFIVGGLVLGGAAAGGAVMLWRKRRQA
jgi:hypothetical protein